MTLVRDLLVSSDTSTARDWILVDPVVPPSEMSSHVGVRGSVSARRVGFLDNNKQNAREIEAAVARWMGPTLKIEVSNYRKTNASVPADPILIGAMVSECQVIVTGSADCGSCTSATVHDAVALRSAGLPTAVITTSVFADLARAQARSLGAPPLDLIVLPHPIGGVTGEELQLRCDEAVRQVSAWWHRLHSDEVST